VAKWLRFVRACGLVVLAVSILSLSAGRGRGQIVSGDDINPNNAVFWGNLNNSSPFAYSYGMDGKGTIALINTRIYRVSSKWDATHVSDGTNTYNHFHLWDTKGPDYQAANLTLANNYWNAVFGVSNFTGKGKLDGDTVTKDLDANLLQDCSTYSFTYTGCKGVWKNALSSEEFQGATKAITDAVPKLTDVKNNDIIFYTNGTRNLGMHYTIVQTTQKSGENNVPLRLRWKFMVSGIYLLDRSKNYFDTPMWSAAGAVNTWKELPAGAGDSTQMDSLRRKK
jgi:hypothetical protein